LDGFVVESLGVNAVAAMAAMVGAAPAMQGLGSQRLEGAFCIVDAVFDAFQTGFVVAVKII
jgi:hypothetical protein